MTVSYNLPLDLKDISTSIFPWETNAFENLCKEYLESKYEFAWAFIISNSYPWIEAEPLQNINNKKRYSFQAKFATNPKQELINSFFRDKQWDKISQWKFKDFIKSKNLTCQIQKKDLKRLDVLYIFALGWINNDSKIEFQEAFDLFKAWIDIEYFTWESFSEELKKDKYVLIRQKYYHEERVWVEMHTRDKSNWSNYGSSAEIEWSWHIIHDPVGWLIWDVKNEDKSRACELHEWYMINKFMYVWTQSFLKLEEIERLIADKKFKTVENHSKDNNKNFWNILEYAKNEIEKIDEGRVHIQYLIEGDQNKEGLFIEYWARWDAEFHFLTNKVLFIDKRIDVK